jgi:hypothetical protein
LDNIFVKVFLWGVAAGAFYLFTLLLTSVPWDQYFESSLFVEVGYLMQGLIALGGMAGSCYGAYVIYNR